MATVITCHNCKRSGHERKDCNQLNKRPDKSGNLESSKKKWCTYHRSKSYLNKDCFSSSRSQKISKMRKYGALITRAEAIRTTTAITREMVAVILPLRVKLQNIIRLLWTAL